MINTFSDLPDDTFLGLAPWAWVTLDSTVPSHTYEYVAGVHGRTLAALNDARALLRSEIEALIGDVAAGRLRYDDPRLPPLLEDAYAETVASRPGLAASIEAQRRPDGSFHWDYALDADYRSSRVMDVVQFTNSHRKEIKQGELQSLSGADVGWLIGLLDGSRMVGDLRMLMAARGTHIGGPALRMLDNMAIMGNLVSSRQSSVQQHWLENTQDGDLVHLGHAALMYRAGTDFFLFDPYLMPWYAHVGTPSPWTGNLPRPAGIFFTHEHADHLDERALMSFPKNTPMVVPKRTRSGLFFDYHGFLGRLGFTDIRELGHGETIPFKGGHVEAIPFYGEDPCDVTFDRNCYLIVRENRNVLVWADSGPANDGTSPLSTGVLDDMVARNGKVDLILCSQQQLMELRAMSVYCGFSPPGTWLKQGENGFLTNDYLAEVSQRVGASQFISYATGGADWLPDTHCFIFHNRNKNRAKLVQAAWRDMDTLSPELAKFDCAWHRAQAYDIYRAMPDGRTQILPQQEQLAPALVHGLDHD